MNTTTNTAQRIAPTTSGIADSQYQRRLGFRSFGSTGGGGGW
jgi:hypothetical protein